MKTLDDLLRRAVACWPERPAVSCHDTTYRYREVAAFVDAAADRLRCARVSAGDRVAVRLSNTVEFVAVLFACARLGAVFVPLSRKLSAYQMTGLLASLGAAILVSDMPAADGPSFSAMLTVLPGADITRAVDPGDTAAAPAGHAVNTPVARPDDLAFILFTSGSTALPKGVMCSHRQVMFSAGAIGQCLRYRNTDKILVAIAMSFDYALYQTLLAFRVGAEVVLADVGDIGALTAQVRRVPITVLPVVPALANLLLTVQKRSSVFGAVRMVTNTGAALTNALGARLQAVFRPAEIVPMYGITECKRVSIMPPGQWATRPGSSGRPLPGVTVTVVDAECHPLPSGRVGEIVVTGPNVTSGYWRDPAATAACFRLASAAAGTLFTGDYGTIDADGYLYIAGRRDDQFKRRGVRTSAVEIESAAEDIAGVGLAALLLAPDPDDIHLVVVPDASGASLTADDVLRQLGARLEAAKVPRACTLLGDPPLTASGKIDKKAISDMLETA